MSTDIASFPGQCPLCPSRIPPNTMFTCPKCWWEIPANDRTALSRMHRRKQPTGSKLMSVIRKVKERRA